jgi:hypothetical protein
MLYKMNRDLVFAEDKEFLSQGGGVSLKHAGKSLPAEGAMYDVVDISIDSILDDMASK